MGKGSGRRIGEDPAKFATGWDGINWGEKGKKSESGRYVAGPDGKLIPIEDHVVEYNDDVDAPYLALPLEKIRYKDGRMVNKKLAKALEKDPFHTSLESKRKILEKKKYDGEVAKHEMMRQIKGNSL